MPSCLTNLLVLKDKYTLHRLTQSYDMTCDSFLTSTGAAAGVAGTFASPVEPLVGTPPVPSVPFPSTSVFITPFSTPPIVDRFPPDRTVPPDMLPFTAISCTDGLDTSPLDGAGIPPDMSGNDNPVPVILEKLNALLPPPIGFESSVSEVAEADGVKDAIDMDADGVKDAMDAEGFNDATDADCVKEAIDADCDKDVIDAE